jgi:hypothetical protein
VEIEDVLPQLSNIYTAQHTRFCMHKIKSLSTCGMRNEPITLSMYIYIYIYIYIAVATVTCEMLKSYGIYVCAQHRVMHMIDGHACCIHTTRGIQYI